MLSFDLNKAMTVLEPDVALLKDKAGLWKILYRIVSARENIGKYNAISTNATNIPMKIIIAGSISESAAVIFVFTSSS